jgi:hypothetical protein
MMVEMMGLEPTTPCLQSQIGQDRHLRRQGNSAGRASLMLSVAVRPGPVMTAVNGTLVARRPGNPIAEGDAVGSACTIG